jgi:hypothetical protein
MMEWDEFGRANPRDESIVPYAVDERLDGFCANVTLTVRGFSTPDDAQMFMQRIEDVVMTRDLLKCWYQNSASHKIWKSDGYNFCPACGKPL